MENLQIVVSVMKTTSEASRKAFEVKVGLNTVGTVYLIPSGWPYEDMPEHHDRWVFEGDICSLDEELSTSYDSRMEAVYALLSATEKSA